MDLIKNIEEYFDQNKDFDDFTKIRYIYLYLCKTFSYDIRFYSRISAVKKEIYNEKIDVRNVQNFEVVCKSLSEIFEDVLNHFGFDTQINKEVEDATYTHTYITTNCTVDNETYRLKLDPTINHDVTRVKMDSPTLGFIDLDNHENFESIMEKADNSIKETQPPVNHEEQLNSITIKQLCELVEKSGKMRNLDDYDLFFEKLDYIMCLINTRKDLKHYDDMDYYYSYLIKNFKLNDDYATPNIMPGVFYDLDNTKDIILLSLVQYNDIPKTILYLRKENDEFKIEEIGKRKATELLEKYTNYDCQYFFEDFVQNLPDDKEDTPNGSIKKI